MCVVKVINVSVTGPLTVALCIKYSRLIFMNGSDTDDDVGVFAKSFNNHVKMDEVGLRCKIISP